jgi:hypothetical protein
MKMKRESFKIAFACLALVVCAAHSARAQEEADLSRIPTQTATLFSQVKHQDYDRASYSFELGMLGDEKFPERRARYNLRYGGVYMDGIYWFNVEMGRDSRSQLKDLGEMNWADVYLVPVLFASDLPYDGLVGVSYKDGKVAEVTPTAIHVRPVTGHMYVLHAKDHDSDFYVMFRVESLEPEGQCTISWKRVPSPDADQPTADSEK